MKFTENKMTDLEYNIGMLFIGLIASIGLSIVLDSVTKDQQRVVKSQDKIQAEEDAALLLLMQIQTLR